MSVLHIVGCAAPPVLRMETLIGEAMGHGWDVCLILTPTADRWLAEHRERLAAVTGRPVRSTYKLPGTPDAHPPADAIAVAPATSNTINKWAAGISDTLALGRICEAIGLRIPLVALPFLNDAQAEHPAYARSVDTLSGAGVRVMPRSCGQGPDFPWSAALDVLGHG